MGILPRGGMNMGGGTSEHEELNGRRGIGPDGKAWHLDTDAYNRLMNMQFYRGAFTDEEALKTAHVTDTIGSYAIVLSTQTFWIWSGMGTGWVDTGAAVTEVAGLPPGGDAGQVLGKVSAADNDVAWIDQTAGGKENHNDLAGLQGGGATERFHITDFEHSTVTAIALGRPLKPENLSPVDGADDVLEMAVFESSPYVNPYGSPMYGYQIQINAGNGTLVYDSGNAEMTSTMFRVPAGVLTVSTTYTWRVRYQAGNLRWSDWSEPTGFKTVADFSAFIVTPSLLMPANDAVVSGAIPTLITTAFEAAGGLLQDEGDFEISATSDFSSIVDSGVGKTIFVGTQELTRGVPYWARARHRATTGELSSFSFPHSFTVRRHYRDTRLALVLVDAENFVFDLIGRDYSPIRLDADFFYWHPIWQVWENSLQRDNDGVAQYTLINGQAMMVIPAFYRRSGKVPSGVYEGQRMWMIDSTVPTAEEITEGWHVDRSFIFNGLEHSHVNISACLVKNESGTAVSQLDTSAIPDNKLWASQTAYMNGVNARNSDSSNLATRGWYAFAYQHYYMLLLFAMIEQIQTQAVMDRLILPNLSLSRPNSRWGQFWSRLAYKTGHPTYGGGMMLFGVRNNSLLSPGEQTTYTTIPMMLSYDSSKLTHSQRVNHLYDSEKGAPESAYVDDFFLPYRGADEANVAIDSKITTPNSKIYIQNYGSYRTIPINGVLDVDSALYNSTSVHQYPNVFGFQAYSSDIPTSAPSAFYKQNLMTKYDD